MKIFNIFRWFKYTYLHQVSHCLQRSRHHGDITIIDTLYARKEDYGIFHTCGQEIIATLPKIQKSDINGRLRSLTEKNTLA